MSFLRGFLASPEQTGAPSDVETIERLCDRLETATLLDDRRDAIRALKSLSKKYQVEIGTHAMELLMGTVREDASDLEITELVLDTLLNVMSSKGEEPSGDDLGVQFTEMFLKNEENVPLLLTLLEEYEFHVRWPTVKLIILLLKNKSKELQERVLVSPMAISRLMDLLSDSREIIRNDGLLLMIKLTKNNPSIQKIVAFENAFERLFHILTVEGNSDGGVIVEDCLNLLLNLLRNNASNQNFFRETSNIQRIAPFFDMNSEEGEEGEEEEEVVWSVQKQNNILLMLDTIQVLVNPLNNPQSVTSSQKVLYTRGVFMKLMDLLLSPSIPREVFAKLLCTIGNIMRGNELIQQFMDELEMSDREAIVLILMLMVNDKQPFSTRISALYCVQCFLFRNSKGQASIVTTLLPNQDSVNTSVTSGQLLCAGLFSTDPTAHWLCCVVLAHCLLNNNDQHENLLLVQLELVPGEAPVFLLNHAFSILISEKHPQTRLGLLMLLVQWVNESPSVVVTLLKLPKFVPLLLELIENKDSQEDACEVQGAIGAILLGLCYKYNDNTCEQYNKSTLQHLITHRVGLDDYRELLDSMLVRPQFIAASKTPQPSPSDTLALDYAFTRTYKKLTDVILKSLEGEEEVEQDQNTIETHDLIVTGYKELIKEQDEELTKLRAELEGIRQTQTTQVEQLQMYAQTQEAYYQQYIQQLQTWYNEQMAATAAAAATQPPPSPTAQPADTSARIEELEAEINRLRLERQQQEQHVAELVARLEQTTLSHQDSQERIRSLEGRCEELRSALASSEAETSQLQGLVKERDDEVSRLGSEVSRLERLLEESEGERTRVSQEGEGERTRLTQEREGERTQMTREREEEVARLTAELEILRSQLLQAQSENQQPIVCEVKEQQTVQTEHLSQQQQTIPPELQSQQQQTLGIEQESQQQQTVGTELQSQLQQTIPTELHSQLQQTTIAEVQSQEQQTIEPAQQQQTLAELHEQGQQTLPPSLTETSQQTAARELNSREQQTPRRELSHQEQQTLVRQQSDQGQQTVETPHQDQTSASDGVLSQEQTGGVSTQQQQGQEGHSQGQDQGQGGYLYDYSAWFTQVQGPDGMTYYQATDGNVYNEAQYQYLIEQYDAYYRSLQQQQSGPEVVQQQQSGTEVVQAGATREEEGVAVESTDTEISNLKAEVASLRETVSQLTGEVKEKDLLIVQLRELTAQAEASLQTKMEELTQTEASLQAKLTQTEASLQAQTEQMTGVIEELEEARRAGEGVERTRESSSGAQLSKSEVSMQVIESERALLQRSEMSHVTLDGGESDNVAQRADDVTQRADDDVPQRADDDNTATTEMSDVYKDKYESLASEQEDLLILLAHQDKEIAGLKDRLRSLGETITTSSEDGDDDFDDLLLDDEDLPATSALTHDGRLNST